MLTGEFTALGRHAHARGDAPGRSRASASTRPRRARCSARCARCPRPSSRRSTRAARTAWRRSTATTSRSTTARATACSPAPASSSTTNRRGAGWSSSRARSPTAAARIKLGLAKSLSLGNLDARRDWGFAGDYVRAMWLMLQQEQPDDYVVATGEAHSVRELVELAFAARWPGLAGARARGPGPGCARPRWITSSATPARRAGELGWEPTVDFQGLVEMMVDADLAALTRRGRGAAPR